MKFFNRTLLLALFIAGIIIIGKFIPPGLADKGFLNNNDSGTQQNKTAPAPRLKENKKQQTSSPPTENDPWQQALLDSLKERYQLNTKDLRRRAEKSWQVKLPKGKPLLVYSIELKNMCRAMNIPDPEGFVLKNARTTYLFQLKKGGDSLTLKLSHSNKVLPGHANLALVFNKLDDITPKNISLLQSLNWNHTLIVDPMTDNKPLLQYARSEKPAILARLPLEPFEYPYQNPGEATILIHFKKTKIEKMLLDLLKPLPNSIGFSTYYGSRAVENKKFLSHLAQFMQNKQLCFLDLTGSGRSYSTQVSREFDILSRKGKVFQRNLPLQEYLTKKIITSKRYGEALAVIPYSKKNIQEIDALLKSKNLKEQGVELVGYADLNNY